MKYPIAPLAALSLIAIGALYSALHAQPAPSQTTRSVWEGVYNDEQAKRGQALYNKECAKCHGDELSGGESAPPLAGAEFLSNWNGLTVGDLFERTRISMPQDKPGKLSRQQNSDILAYMFTFNRFPAGKTELPQQAEVLKQIRIEFEKSKDK
jgi:cytochrome c